jgi:xanthine dehydrogenase YagS FAD-binding subunit
MNPFAYARAEDTGHALAEVARRDLLRGTDRSHFIGGGTNLLDLMKENLVRPGRLVDITRLPLDRIEDLPGGGLRLGALARNAPTAWDDRVRTRYPLLSAAMLAAASPQIRNMATNGGNLLQRTRCWYFYDAQVACNKRAPGSGCSARGGLARQHAILGASEHCIATHPSDMAVALAALEAVVQVRSPRGERALPIGEFHRLPGDRPQDDTLLAADELVTAIDLPPGPWAAHSAYLKIRERASYAFALVSVAAALDLGGDGRIVGARLALGGVAHKPWRVPEAEQLLAGQAPGREAFEAAAERLLQGAQPQGEGPGSNAFKIPLARRAIVRALQTAVRGTVPNTGEDRA